MASLGLDWIGLDWMSHWAKSSSIYEIRMASNQNQSSRTKSKIHSGAQAGGTEGGEALPFGCATADHLLCRCGHHRRLAPRGGSAQRLLSWTRRRFSSPVTIVQSLKSHAHSVRGRITIPCIYGDDGTVETREDARPCHGSMRWHNPGPPWPADGHPRGAHSFLFPSQKRKWN